MSSTTTPATTPATTDTEDFDLIGCDHCDFTSTYEDDFASLGGDRQTESGLVAYPTTCNACDEAEYKKAERLYSRLVHTRPEALGLCD